MDDFIYIKLSLTTEYDITKALEHFNTSVQNAACSSIPQLCRNNSSLQNVPATISDLIAAKRKARKKWQQIRFPLDIKHLNFLSQKLKKLQKQFENRKVQGQLERLDTTKSTDYSLWKITKSILKSICSQPPNKNSDNKWVKTDIQKPHNFANHLSIVFSPNPVMHSNDILQEVNQVLAETIDSNTSIKRFLKSNR